MEPQSITENNVLELLHTIDSKPWHYSRYVGTTGLIVTLEWPFGQFTTTSLDVLYGYARAIVNYYNR